MSVIKGHFHNKYNNNADDEDADNSQAGVGQAGGIPLGSVADYYFGRKPATPLTFALLALHRSFLSGLCGRSDEDHGSDAFYVHLLITCI